jgi:hypothetical protein
MAALIRAGACLLLVLLVACERDPTQLRFDNESIVVHSVLMAGAAEAELLIVRMQAQGSGWGLTALPITGAHVRLSHGQDTIRLLPSGRLCGWMHDLPGDVDPTSGCYAGAVAGGIESGRTYQLTIDLPGGRRVTGATTVPHPPAIIGGGPATLPVARTHAVAPTLPPVTMAWTGTSAAAHAQLRISVDHPECGVWFSPTGESFGQMWADVTGRTEAMITHPLLGCGQDVPFAAGTGSIIVSVFDANYSRYAANGPGSSTILSSESAHGVNGAWGVLGAVANAVAPVVIQVVD